jgi:hypothetical protein
MKKPGTPDPAQPFSAVFDRELAAVREARRLRGQPDRELAGSTPEERAHDARLFGLAFSGGGIRSATFNLGVAQALAQRGILSRFDYLSLASGGGYIGGWLAAWIRRSSMSEVEKCLASNCSAAPGAEPPEPGDPPEPRQIRFLRRFSNYLTPQVGLYSADTWTLVATYLRNLLLNLSVLVLALSAILLLPRLVLLGASVFQDSDPYLPLALGVACLAVGILFLGRNQAYAYRPPSGDPPWYTRQGWIQATVVLPLFASTWFASVWLWAWNMETWKEKRRSLSLAAWAREKIPGVDRLLPATGEAAEAVSWALLSAALYFGVWLAALVFSATRERGRRDGDVGASTGEGRLVAACLLGAVPAGAMGGLLLWLLHRLGEMAQGYVGGSDVEGPVHLVHINALRPAAMILVFMLTAFLHTGLMGRAFPETLRQWWSRLGAWMLIYSLTWLNLFAVALYGPMALVILGSVISSGVGLGWLGSTLGGVLAGRRAASSKEQPGLVQRLVIAVAPQLFIVGLLAVLALGLHAILSPPATGSCEAFWTKGEWNLHLVKTVIGCHSGRILGGTTPLLLLFAAALALAALVLSSRVDINEFSMHLFYRNRLISAYLGASNPDRRPVPFTGYDPADDLPLASLSPFAHNGNESKGYDGPYPIYNTALNLVVGEELAWQERKAASFPLAPLMSGYSARKLSLNGNAGPLERHGYRPTDQYRPVKGGISLGTAMAISGAAASPSRGAGTTPAMAFLLTVFNVRLGWWIGNPRHSRTWNRLGPTLGLWPLLTELFAQTGERSRYVYLSDGGHFDNTGIYELVRRRCRFIVASDSGADPKPIFDDLGSAIRKCCTDFGVDIDLDVTSLQPDPETRRSKFHFVVGKIRYDRVEPGAAPGLLLYIKSSLTGDEPADCVNYAAEHPEFPHESTADQWFGESQFESYRKLGEHIAWTMFEAEGQQLSAESLDPPFDRLRKPEILKEGTT